VKVASLFAPKPLPADDGPPPGYSHAEHVRRLYAANVAAGWHPADARRCAERDAAWGLYRRAFPIGRHRPSHDRRHDHRQNRPDCSIRLFTACRDRPNAVAEP
jgi:hypothetical protein